MFHFTSKHLIIRQLCTACILGFVILALPLHGYSPKKFRFKFNDNDTTKVRSLLKEGKQLLDEGSYEKASERASKAFTIANKTELSIYKGESLLLLGSTFHARKEYATALDFYLQASSTFEETNNTDCLHKIYYRIGLLYKDWEVYEKAIEYFNRSLMYNDPSSTKSSLTTIQQLAEVNNKLKHYDDALKHYQQLLNQCKKTEDFNCQKKFLLEISTTYLAAGKHEMALQTNLRLLDIELLSNDTASLAQTYNNIGFLYRYLNKPEKSLTYFKKSISLDSADSESTQKAVTLTNMGVIFQNLEKHEQSLTHFHEAIVIWEAHHNANEISRLYNYIASVHLSKENLEVAKEHLRKAIHLAEESQSGEVLIDSYKLMSDIYKKSGHYKKSYFYFNQYVTLKDSFLAKQISAQEEMLSRQYEIEKKEQELKLMSVDKQVQNLNLKKLTADAQKKEKELELLKREKELQASTLQNEKLEKAKTEQSLMIAEQNLLNAQRAKQIALLEKAKQQKEFELKNKELEEERKKDRIRKLELEQKIQKEQLIDASNRQRYLTSILGLAGVVILLIVLGFFANRRANRKLKEANLAISTQKKQVETAYENLTTLSEIGQRITSTLHFEELMTTISQNLNKLMPFSTFGIAVVTNQGNNLRFNVIKNNKSLYPFDLPVNQVTHPAAKAFSDCESILLHEQTINGSEAFEGNRSAIYEPLIIDNQAIGIVTIQNDQSNSYSNIQRRLFSSIASYTSIALDNGKAYNIIHQKNNHITASIRYAKRIQTAILPDNQAIETLFPESFIIYKPKDIVSGDFYWFSEIESEHAASGSYQFVAVVDCTGHGVPGAFMSMIGNTLLNELINQKGILEPSSILHQLDLGVKNAVQNQQSNANDGMDICLCRIEKLPNNKVNIVFAGAKRPLYIHNKEGLKTINGDRLSIGSTHKSGNFHCKTTQVNQGDMLYLLTDGYIDQANPQRKRLGTERFHQLLKQHAQLSIQKQKEAFETALLEHQQNADQRDDITLVGLKLS